MNGLPQSTRTLLLATALGLLLPLLVPGTGWPQPRDQIVESLEAHQARVEKLIEERLSALIPSQKYVLRVLVEGEKIKPPAAVSPEGIPELPGFRQSFRAPTTEGERYRITRIGVRIVINEEVKPSDLNYIRSLVPVLADFDTARGDHLELQVIPVEIPEQPAEARPAESPPPPAPEGPLGFGMRDWLLIGLMGLVLLFVLVVLLRVFFLPKPQPVVAAPVARPAPEPLVKDELSQEEQELRVEREREKTLEGVRKDVVKSLVGRTDLSRLLIRDWQGQPDKIVALVHALGPRVARQAVMPHLDREGYRALEETVRKEEPPAKEQIIEVLREANLYLITQELVRPEEIRTDPFAFLGELSRGQIAHLVKDEPVRIKAMVLSRISPEDTAHILEGMPKEVQLEVAVQIGNFSSLPLDAMEEVAYNLAEKARHLPDERTVDIEGPKALVDLIGRTSSGTIRYLLQAVKAKDRKLSEEIEKRFFLFESIPLVPEEMLPQAVRLLPSAVVVQAIQGADPELQRKVILAFPEQARTGMVTELRAARADLATVTEARRQVVARFQQLAEEGKLDLKAISDAWQQKAKAS